MPSQPPPKWQTAAQEQIQRSKSDSFRPKQPRSAESAAPSPSSSRPLLHGEGLGGAVRKRTPVEPRFAVGPGSRARREVGHREVAVDDRAYRERLRPAG